MGTVSSVDEKALSECLAALQQDLLTIQKQRNLRTAIGGGGFVLIMAIVGLFMLKLHDYALNYPAQELTKALGRETEKLLAEPETLQLAGTFRQRAAQVLLPAIAQKLEADAPKFNDEAQGVVNDLQSYLNNEISRRASQQLAASLQQVHAELLQSYGQLPVDKVQQATAEAQQEYLRQLKETLNRHLQKSGNSLQSLQSSLAALEHSPGAASMLNKSPEALQTDFYAAVLEMALYSLKPERGTLIPAHHAGGTH